VKIEPLAGTDQVRQAEGAVIWEVVAEGRFRMMKQVLAVEEANRSLDARFSRHGKKITPLGPFGKSNGEQFLFNSTVLSSFWTT